MRRKPRRKGDRLIDFPKCRVVIFLLRVECWAASITIQFRMELVIVLMRLDKISPHFRLTRRFQVDLEIASSGVSAKVQPLRLIQPCRRCVETSGDVTENAFTVFARIRRAFILNKSL